MAQQVYVLPVYLALDVQLLHFFIGRTGLSFWQALSTGSAMKMQLTYAQSLLSAGGLFYLVLLGSQGAWASCTRPACNKASLVTRALLNDTGWHAVVQQQGCTFFIALFNGLQKWQNQHVLLWVVYYEQPVRKNYED